MTQGRNKYKEAINAISPVFTYIKVWKFLYKIFVTFTRMLPKFSAVNLSQSFLKGLISDSSEFETDDDMWTEDKFKIH